MSGDGCPAILEPDQTCTITLHYAPATGGVTFGRLAIASDQGTLSLPVSAVAASVSALTSSELPLPHFRVAGDGDGVGKPQALLMQITNPLPASVRTGALTITGPDAQRFAVAANACRGVVLGPGQSCGLAVTATPDRPGTSRATLTLGGQGQPLTAPLTVTAFPTAAVERLRPAHGTAACAAGGLLVLTDRVATVRWWASRAAGPADRRCARGHPRPRTHRGLRRCRRRPGPRRASGPDRRPSRVRDDAAMPPDLRPGVYRITVNAADRHGSGPHGAR